MMIYIIRLAATVKALYYGMSGPGESGTRVAAANRPRPRFATAMPNGLADRSRRPTRPHIRAAGGARSDRVRARRAARARTAIAPPRAGESRVGGKKCARAGL